MKKTTFLKTLLLTVGLLVGVNNAWAVDVPTPVYFNNFTHNTGLTIQGSGSFTTDSDPRFGKVFSNAASASPRTNYLILPSTVFSSFTPEGGKTAMTISFWVNAKNCGDASAYTYAPLFAAYSAAPTNVVVDEVVTGTTNTSPMICLQSRGLIQINNWGWCDFTPALNKDGKNTVYNTNAWEVGETLYSNGGNWLDDSNWHLYTLTLTASQATVYLDGVLKNQWNLDGETDGQIISGMFTKSAENLTYVSLGGNQAWNLGDNDAAFMFDDFAVYDVALSAEQIAQIITDKTTSTDITSLSANYSFDATSNINPFDNGAIWHGTYVDAFLPSAGTDTRGLAATAYFDSNTETAGRQPFTLSSGDVVSISMLMYNGYNSAQSNNATSYSVYNSDGVALVSFTYNSYSCKFTDVSFAGTSADGFEEFSGQSAFNNTQSANGIIDGTKPFLANSGYNPVITISIAADGKVSINFVRTKTSEYNKTFTATLSDKKMDLAKIVMASSNYGKSGVNNGNRISGIGYMNFAMKHAVTVRAVDSSSNALSTISTHEVADGETLTYTYPRYVLNGTTVYWKNKQASNEYRITSPAITASQTLDVVYSQYATDGYFYTEAEALDGVTVATTSGASSRTSMSALGYGNNIAVTTLPAGTYKATIGWYGKKGETCTVMAGETTAVSSTQNGSWGETIGSEFTLTSPTAVTMSATGNNYTGIDYILIEKTKESKTISAAGWATYCSPYALDFSEVEGLEAYLITGYESNPVLHLESVDDVPANTGVILKGNGTYSIPVVVSSSTDVSENKLVGVTASETLLADGGYVLMNGTNGVGFYKNNNDFTLGANTAYLPADFADGMAREFFLFEDDGTTTGIADVRSKMSDVRGDVFDLQGRKVAQPAKGLYIVNGKKVVIK